MEFKLARWAERKGKIVKWGNMVGPYRGQEFEETFKTNKQAIERERQAKACEAIGDKRVPIPLKRVDLRANG